MEGWRKFTKLNLQEASRFSQDLQNFVDGDQKLRNLFAQEMEKAGGWSQELVNKFVELHGTPKMMFLIVTKQKKILLNYFQN